MKTKKAMCDCPSCRTMGLLHWLESVPGGLSTILLLICFLAGAYGLFALWNLKEIVWKP